MTSERGTTFELPEATILASILMAVESDRREIRNRVASSFEEEVEAVANLFWPFVVLRGSPDAPAAVLDVTGVWHRTFRFSPLPPESVIRPALSPTEELEGHRQLLSALVQALGTHVAGESLTVEGFLPTDPPLLGDLVSLTQSEATPPEQRSGFLPARHEWGWYEGELHRVREWLDRYEHDLGVLRALREQFETILQANGARLVESRLKLDEEHRARVKGATGQAESEIDRLQQLHTAEAQRHLDSIRHAHREVVHSETAIATADTLAARASQRQGDHRPHEMRAREARAAIREARRQIRLARRAIAGVHERQRASQEEALGQVSRAERVGVEALARLDLFQDDYVETGSQLLRMLDAQIDSRQTQKHLLESCLLELPGHPTARVIWLPLWVASLRGPRGVRHIFFPPLKVRAEVGVSGALKRLFGGLALPLEPRTARFDRGFRSTLEEAVGRDPWLERVIENLTHAANVLDAPDVLARLDEGLADLRGKGWISEGKRADCAEGYRELILRRRGRMSSSRDRLPERSPDAEWTPEDVTHGRPAEEKA